MGGSESPTKVRWRRQRWVSRNFGSYAAYRRWQRQRAGIKTVAEKMALTVAKHEREKLERRERAKRERANRPKHPLVERFMRDHPKIAAKLKPRSLYWRARYEYDQQFRAREITRAHTRKACAGWIDDGTLTGEAINSLFSKAKRCAQCRRRMLWGDKSLDHIVPKSKGGAHSIFNVRVICKTCNTKKGTRFEQYTLHASS